MVRRERAIRRLRDSVVVEDLEDDNRGPGRFRRLKAVLNKSMMGRGNNNKPTPAPTPTELQARPRPRSLAVEKESVATQPGGTDLGEEETGNPVDLARRRMMELAGSQLDDGEPHFTRCKSVILEKKGKKIKESYTDFFGNRAKVTNKGVPWLLTLLMEHSAYLPTRACWLC